MTQRFGRYEILRPLGRGGMAELFVARYRGPEGFEKRLVIKRVLPKLAGNRRSLRLFFEEARIQVSLSHANLVPVFDFGRVGNDYFIAMEHVRGCDLATLLQAARERDQPLGPRLVVHLGAELCRGLAYVHRRGYVHRDVAPRNVLLSVEGEVRLSDFGVALSTESDAAPGIRGTIVYMAPEQARGERVDGRADLYSLGMLIAESILLKRVRPAEEPQPALERARNADPVSVEGPLAGIVLRATAPDPKVRFADAEEMLQALEEVAAILGGSATAASRELAARVTELAPSPEEPIPDDELPPEGETAGLTPAVVAAVPPLPLQDDGSYFRGAPEPGSFVDDVLGESSPREPTSARPARRRGLPLGLGIGLGLALLVGAGREFLLRPRGPDPSTPARAPVAAPAVRAAPAPVPALAVPVPAVAPDPAPSAGDAVAFGGGTAAGSSAAPSRIEARPPAATLTVYCTPWCVPLVDGRPRGEGGRRHVVSLAPGSHRVVATRLDDKRAQTVEVRAGEARRLDFTF